MMVFSGVRFEPLSAVFGLECLVRKTVASAVFRHDFLQTW